ncbi:MAG: hypothetical protein WAQ24_03135 [Candidatus Saccharimonadales bacterium]
MSRALADLLGVDGVVFGQQIRQLERAAGLPSNDIRLAAHTLQATRQKIRELGLDPIDTTGPELYRALQSRLKRDEVQVRAALNVRADCNPVDLLENIQKKLAKLEHHSDVFVIKSAVMKQIIKKLKPKATMKRLGYRSMDSMLKHESAAQLLAACQVTESLDWQEARLAAYTKLQVRDFETRKPQFIVPTAKQWPKIADQHALKHKQTSVVLPELGAVVLLPMNKDLPGLAITTFVLALHALNDMRAISAYLKLQQVKPNFGLLVRDVVLAEPLTEVEQAGRKLSWKSLQWSYGHGFVPYMTEVFGPHIQPEDLAWQSVSSTLPALHPILAFWQETDALGLLDSQNAVSLNILDVALGVCNHLEYAERTVHHMREALGRQLFARYLHYGNLETMLSKSFGNELVPELEFS